MNLRAAASPTSVPPPYRAGTSASSPAKDGGRDGPGFDDTLDRYADDAAASRRDMLAKAASGPASESRRAEPAQDEAEARDDTAVPPGVAAKVAADSSAAAKPGREEEAAAGDDRDQGGGKEDGQADDGAVAILLALAQGGPKPDAAPAAEKASAHDGAGKDHDDAGKDKDGDQDATAEGGAAVLAFAPNAAAVQASAASDPASTAAQAVASVEDMLGKLAQPAAQGVQVQGGSAKPGASDKAEAGEAKAQPAAKPGEGEAAALAKGAAAAAGQAAGKETRRDGKGDEAAPGLAARAAPAQIRTAAAPDATAGFAAQLSQAQSGGGGAASTAAAQLTGQAQAHAPVPAATHDIALRIGQGVAAGEKVIEMRLSPDQMGQVDVRLEFAKDGQLTAHLVADNAQALQMLQQDKGELARLLTQQQDGGQSLSPTLNFSLREGGTGGRSGGQDGSSRGRGRQIQVEGVGDSPAPAATTSRRGSYLRALDIEV